MTAKEKFLSSKKRYQPILLPKEFSDEEMARDWTLSEDDKTEVGKYRKNSRLFLAVQLCSLRLYGRFLKKVNDLSPRIVTYLNKQLELPPTLIIKAPGRKATDAEHRQSILDYLNFRKLDEEAQGSLENWLEDQASRGKLPKELFQKAERHLLESRLVLPGASVLERLIISVCSRAHEKIYNSIYSNIPPELKQAIERLLSAPEKGKHSLFNELKEYPPSAKIGSLQNYLKRYRSLVEAGIDDFEKQYVTPAFLEYLYKLTKRYNARDLKRFNESKRYALMFCFLVETQKILLDYLVKMHDQYITDMSRHSKNEYEKKHRKIRKQQKKAVDNMLATSNALIDLPDEQPVFKKEILPPDEEKRLRESIQTFYQFQHLEERGYGDLLLARYPSLRKYFADFIQLPFAVEQGSSDLMTSIELIRRLDKGGLKKLPKDAPTAFIPKELRRALKDKDGNINRNAWEMGIAFAIKDTFRSGDLYLPKSKQHVSFWDMMLKNAFWQENKDAAYSGLNLPRQNDIKSNIILQFKKSVDQANKCFESDGFAKIENGKLSLKRDDKAQIPVSVTNLQKVINANMPFIRIEKLLMEVDKLTGFSRHFIPIQKHGSRPENFYKTLIATIISQATNLGVVSMSASVKGVSIDMLRHVLNHYIREETISSASAAIVDQHHQLPLSSVHGKGNISSSDGQRFKIRADSLLASYYPRYYGYYEKAIGIYTHVSDQYSVFNTKVISCSPREALYVLDGLLENNTILKIREHTTDTHGYTEIIFALCYLLGYYFMPRIRDLKDQQLYRIDKHANYGVFAPLLNKTANINIVEELWDPMVHVAHSLKERTAPANVIVQRLTNSYPSDRLSKAFTNFGRIIKTEYILRYLTDPKLRRMIQLQLNKGEYRHKLPRWVFFANQGEFTTGDYEEIMNKASCLSLVSNAVLYWNTIKINDIVVGLRDQGESVDNETLSHISLLPYKHVLPNGTYFIEDK